MWERREGGDREGEEGVVGQVGRREAAGEGRSGAAAVQG
jgi:hypothetical protein